MIVSRWQRSVLRIALCLGCAVLCGCREELIHGLSEGNANRLLGELIEAGYEVDKVRDSGTGWALRVESADVPGALRFINQSRLVEPERQPESRGNSLIPDKEEQRLRSEHLLAQEIENSLTSLSGVLHARVHLYRPLAGGMLAPHPVSGRTGSAAVLLTTADELSVSRDDIAALVSGAAGVEQEAVTVVLTRVSQRVSNSRPEILAHNTSQARPANSIEGLLSGLTRAQLLNCTIALLIGGAVMLGIAFSLSRRNGY
ncbi:MAG: hypothetical protein K1X83_05680 [Oligoflexia bacterium]|nr:hypothetical protein [Oligoflexia bacterium]